MKLRALFAFGALLLTTGIGQVQGAIVNWNIDSTQSWIRISIPDQIINIGGGNTLPVAMRDQGANPGSAVAASWTDAGKRLAEVTGTLSTNMTGTSISFNSGAHAAPALASGQWRPDAASWNGSTFDTSLGATTPSVFAADLTVQGLQRIAFLNFYNVNTDYSGTATGLSGWAGTASGGALTAGALAGTTLDLDAIFLIADGRSVYGTLGGAANIGVNSSLTIANLGGLDRELTFEYDVPFLVSVNGLPVNVEFESRIVAYATIPEPASLSLVGLALSFVTLRRRRLA